MPKKSNNSDEYEGSEREFAEKLGITRDQLRTLEERALRKMRKAYLEKYGGTARYALDQHSREEGHVSRWMYCK